MLVRLGRRVGGVSGGAIRPWLAPWLSAPDRADSVRLGGGDDISGARGFRGGPAPVSYTHLTLPTILRV